MQRYPLSILAPSRASSSSMVQIDAGDTFDPVRILEDGQVAIGVAQITVLAQCVGQVMILRGDHDPQQPFLPFVDALVFDTYLPPPHYPKPLSGASLRNMAERTWVWTEDSDRAIFHEEAGVPQLCLPFREHRKMTKDNWARCKQAGWPTFDRDSEGRLLTMKVETDAKPTAMQWCRSNCKGRYSWRKNLVTFEFARDYVLAKMWIDEDN